MTIGLCSSTFQMRRVSHTRVAVVKWFGMRNWSEKFPRVGKILHLNTLITKAATWFPYLREMLCMENLCRLVGFDERLTATLICGKPLEYAGELYSEEHKRKFTTEKAGFQVVKDPTDRTKLILAIDRKPIAEWFKEQFVKIRQNIRRPIQPQRKNSGMKL